VCCAVCVSVRRKCLEFGSMCDDSWMLSQVGRAGRFGTKGLAITFVASKEDSAVLSAVSAW
jgi:hypothetical protein